MGAKQGRTKGNKQKAESTEPEKKAWETRPEIRGKPGKREWNRSTGIANCEAKAGRKWKRKNRRLSSEMLKRKRTKESGSHAPAPEKKFKRGSPEERLRE